METRGKKPQLEKRSYPEGKQCKTIVPGSLNQLAKHVKLLIQSPSKAFAQKR
jgi:hypothetical protein